MFLMFFLQNRKRNIIKRNKCLIYIRFFIILYIMFLLFLMFLVFSLFGFCFLGLVRAAWRRTDGDNFGDNLVLRGTLGTKEHYPFYAMISMRYNVPLKKPKRNIRNITRGVDKRKKMFDKFRELIEKQKRPETARLTKTTLCYMNRDLCRVGLSDILQE